MASLRGSAARRSRGAALVVAAVLTVLAGPAVFLLPGRPPVVQREGLEVWQGFSSEERTVPTSALAVPWASGVAAAAAALMVAAAPALPARASILGDFLAQNKDKSKVEQAATMAQMRLESQAKVLSAAEKKAGESKVLVSTKETQLAKAYDNIVSLDKKKESEKAAGSLSPEEKAREEKLVKIRSVVTADLEKRKLEAQKKAQEAEEIAKRIEALAKSARAAAELAKAQVDVV